MYANWNRFQALAINYVLLKSSSSSLVENSETANKSANKTEVKLPVRLFHVFQRPV